jgi:DNA adenine methylase
VDTNTFVYFDPPYRPLNQTSRFTTYTGNEFGEQDQIRLAEFFGQLDRQRGGKLMLSNSDPKNTDPNDAFFETHFAGHTIHRVSANRAVNCKGEKRGTIHEIVVTNYAYEPQTLAFDF